jgi:hypothetical protein
MTTFEIIYETTETGNTRALIIALAEGGKYIEDIYEADAENVDAMHALVAHRYPNLISAA